MPFALAAEQDPFNANNFNLSQPGTPYSTYSFSNGIRTSPPADPAVYARVVRNTIRHVRGLFAGTTDFGVTWFEVGNEPDLVDAGGAALPYFWTGDEQQFYDAYAAIAAEVDADPLLPAGLRLGAGSFALLPSVPGAAFLQAFLARVAAGTPRLDYLSYHSYGDLPDDHLAKFLLVQSMTTPLGIAAPWVNAEWGRDLGGQDPVYDRIEHGLFRAGVIARMQLFPFELAHEALFRDPGTSGGELGLVKTGPAAHKPVSQVYRGLARLEAAPNALQVTSNADGLVVFPGRDAAGSRVVLAVVVDEPPPKTVTRVDLEVSSLPWGAGAYDLVLSRVTEASSAGPGVEQVSSEVRSGGSLTFDFSVPRGEQGLYLVELTEP